MESEIKLVWLQGFVEATMIWTADLSNDTIWKLAHERWDELHDNSQSPSK
jgi:hypothetical protein